MSTPTQYVQCRFARVVDGSRSETVSWIPTKVKQRDKNGLIKVRPGLTIDLKEEDGSWTRDWQIMSVGNEIKDDAPDVRKMIKGHRKMTGDSQPRRKEG
jgi:hypothetical protein